ncbi:hypothetical protein [Micromonospora tulbaghiae]|uniref:hypothetical protein n=1 Tax=Micromonospora tulbaghiae TaxID=479978 RepID=UPI0033C7CCD8
MDLATDQLRQALLAVEEPTLDAIGGPAAVAAAANGLPSAPEMPFVISLLVDEWERIPDRSPFIELIVECVRVARPYELDDLLDLILSDTVVVPDIAAHLERPLKVRASGEDAAAGIALEAWLRLSLGHWTRSALPLLGKLDEHATTAAEAAVDSLDETFLQRLVRCLGVAGEYWREHSDEMTTALKSLLHHVAVDDNVAFELAMLELLSGLERDNADSAVDTLRKARDYFLLCSQYEDRVDADIFGSAIDAVLAFATGAVPSRSDVDRLKSLVVDYRLATLSESPHWRQPRADTSVQWVELVDHISRLQDLDRGWLDATTLIADIARVYCAHRTVALIQPAAVVQRDNSEPAPPPMPALPALLQPRIESAVAKQEHGLDMLDRWLALMAGTSTSPGDIDAISQVRNQVRNRSAADHPKAPSVDVSALSELVGLDAEDQVVVQQALATHPEQARRINLAAAARLSANEVDVSIYFQRCFARIRDDLLRISRLEGEAALRVEQVARALLRYIRWRGSVTAGSSLAASFQRRFSDESDAPKEGELADDLHQFLAMALDTFTFKEVSHIANGRVDLVAFFGSITLVVECKRELHDASTENLASKYAFQAAEYGWADPGAGFLVVLDLTAGDRRDQLDQCVTVVTVAPPEEGGQLQAVLVGRVQANLPPPSYLSTPAAARRRATADQ